MAEVRAGRSGIMKRIDGHRPAAPPPPPTPPITAKPGGRPRPPQTALFSTIDPDLTDQNRETDSQTVFGHFIVTLTHLSFFRCD